MRHQDLTSGGHFSTGIEMSNRGILLQVGTDRDQARVMLNPTEVDYLVSDLKSLLVVLEARKI